MSLFSFFCPQTSGHRVCTGCHRPLGLHREFESSCLQLLIMKQTLREKQRLWPTFLPWVICILPVTCTEGCSELQEQRKMGNSQANPRGRGLGDPYLQLWAGHPSPWCHFSLSFLPQAGTSDLTNRIRSSHKLTEASHRHTCLTSSAFPAWISTSTR